jgi:Flp pilus assembly protein TadB
MITLFRAFLSANGIVLALTAGLITTALLWDRGRLNAAEERGAKTERRATEQANEQVLQRADRVRSQSLNDGVRGVVDPFYVD